MTTITAEQLAEWKKQAERLRATAGYQRMENGYYNFLGDSLSGAAVTIDRLLAEVERLRAKTYRLQEALTPSADTKAAYIGEFSHRVRSMSDDGEEQYFDAAVPWTTIKEIMAAIRARAALEDGT